MEERSRVSIEKIFDKYKLSLDLVKWFGIKDGPSSLIALHYMNACGYLYPTSLRPMLKDFIKLYSIEKSVLEEHIQFYINGCSNYLRSAYILFPLLLQRVPESISTDNDIMKAIRWINNGILTGDEIVSVIYRCCFSIIEKAVSLNSKNEFVKECFFGDYTICNKWCLAVNNSSQKIKTKILDDIREVIGKEQFCHFNDEQLLKHLVSSKLNESDQQCLEEDNNESSDSDLDDKITYDDSAENVENLCKTLSEQVNMFTTNGSSVFTMGEVIKRLSFQELEETQYGFVINKMPRNSIRKFYKYMKELIKKESQFDDAAHFKRLLIIQLSTHSKKIIDACHDHLDEYAKRLQPADYSDINNFFWMHFQKSPKLFRPYAVSTALIVLCSRTKMDLIDVVIKLCRLGSDKKVASLDDNYDIILSAVLDKNFGFEVNFRLIYEILLEFSRFNWYKSWSPIFKSIFNGVPYPMPLTYFKFRDIELLDNSLDQLTFILENKMPMINSLARLQFSLILLERVYFIGPLGFEHDEWTKRKAQELVNKLKEVNSQCPAYLFKERIKIVCLRFENI